MYSNLHVSTSNRIPAKCSKCSISRNRSESIQKTMLIVDEKGAAAAAGTGTIVGGVSDASRETFILDRPFMFLIRDEETCVNLFSGIVKKLPNHSPAKGTSATRIRR